MVFVHGSHQTLGLVNMSEVSLIMFRNTEDVCLGLSNMFHPVGGGIATYKSDGNNEAGPDLALVN